MYPETDDISEYLISDTIVDWQTPAVRGEGSGTYTVIIR